MTKEFYKCAASQEIYSVEEEGLELSTVCPNDPHFYAVCRTKAQGRMTNDQILCGNYVCQQRDRDNSNLFFIAHKYHILTPCNREKCLNQIPLVDSHCSADTRNCDYVCDIYDPRDGDCTDEADCNGFRYGLTCPNMFGEDEYVHPAKICDGFPFCQSGGDEQNCEVTEDTEYSCVRRQYIYGEKEVPIFNHTRCSAMTYDDSGAGLPYCLNFMEQTNCSDPTRIGGHCEINGYPSTVSTFVSSACESGVETRLCDDLFEMECVQASTICNVQKHKMCDQNSDCGDKSDETNIICDLRTQTTCKRRFGRTTKELPIPLSWLNDGIRDCIDGRDETGTWPTCGEGKTKRLLSENDSCENVYLCQHQSPGYVELNQLCDGRETCGDEIKVCSSTRSFKDKIETKSLTKKKLKNGRQMVASLCLDGLISLSNLANIKCEQKLFAFTNDEILGETKTYVTLPDKEQECGHMYGENYVYMNCAEKCAASQCPLKAVPRYASCPSQHPQRIGTLVNNEYLTFLTRANGGFTNKYFICSNNIRCIDYKDVCNLVDNCGDGSDEEMCTNHFQCINNNSRVYIPHSNVCDGKFDCLDLSDECNSRCSKFILENVALKGFSIAIGGSAILANTLTIFNNFRTITDCRTWTALLNKSLVSSIAAGDFLIGSYLLSVSVYDGIIYGNNFCQEQNKWLTSIGCSALGVISTVGSQLSLFSMVALSLMRIYGIMNSMRIPGEVTTIRSLQIAAGIAMITAASVAVAVIPIADSFEDFFVNGFKYPEQLKLFIGLTSKPAAMDAIEGYYGRMKSGRLSWKMANKMVDEMFSHDTGTVEDYTAGKVRLGFYGNDGVCLFKYFVQPTDPQRDFVWGILALNFVCFILISMSYVAIGFLSSKSSRKITQGNKQIQKRNTRMNRKIAIIIATDFFCWIPFIVICALHSLEVIDATSWYAPISIIILPINSIINPLLYDDTVTKHLRGPLRSISSQITETSVAQWITGGGGGGGNDYQWRLLGTNGD